MRNPNTLPYLLIFTAGVCWGGTFSLTLIATSEGTHPLILTTWQVLLTAIFTAAICLFTKVPPFRLCNLGMYLVIGFLGVVAPDLLYFNAAPHLSAGILSVTVSTVPLFTYLVMLLFGFEPLVIKRAFGIVLGMAAILLLVLPDQGLSSADANFWILWVLVCAVLYSLENVYVAESVGHRMAVFEILSGSTIVSSVFLIPAMFWMGLSEPVSWITSSSGMAVAAIAAVSTFAYAMFFLTIRIAGPVFASQCAYIITVAGVLWGIAIFSEEHTVWVWISVFTMLIGIALVSPSKKEVVQ